VHHHELTYSVAIPSDVALAGPRLDLYYKTHSAMIDSLSDFGVRAIPFRRLGEESKNETDSFLCFQRRTSEDLILSGYKVLGSAQRTTRRAILQHGSLLMQASRWAPQLPGVIDLSSRPISIGQLADSFSASLATALSINWNVDEISPFERRRAVEITTERFASQRWMLRR
jgi:lipoate-protein ligase A